MPLLTKLLWSPAKLPNHVLLLLGFVATFLVGCLDWVVGEEIILSIFYLIPVVVVAWYAGRSAGLLMAGVAAGTQMVSDILGAAKDTGPNILFWNIAADLIVQISAVLLLAKLKTANVQMEQNVAERTLALTTEIAERQRAMQLLRTLAVQLSEAEEAERSQLAADIHDSIGQALSVLKIKLGSHAGPHGVNGPAPDLSDYLELIDDIIRQTRTLTFDLHPAMLEDLGLVPTLNWYAEQFSAQADLLVSISEIGERQQLSPSVTTYLFRAIKELLNNAVKHGRAKEVVVAVHWRNGGGLRIVIDDDGCGFDPVAALAVTTQRGLGLPGIRERLFALGGHLAVESQPEQGTRIILEIGAPAA